MDGIALAYSDLPVELIEAFRLSRFVHERGGEREIRFLRGVPEAVLPIRHQGRLRIVAWGSRSGKLPRTGFTWRSTVEAGEWVIYRAEPIEIPAIAGLQNGVWFKIRSGVRGLVAEVGGDEAAYMIVEPSTYYFKIMTRSDRMPSLIEEQI
jgi:hypothetical protein